MKFVLCQISNRLLNPETGDISEKFHKTFFENKYKDGYYKPEHFWELPKWISEICYTLPDNVERELLVIENMQQVRPLKCTKDTAYLFSVLECNKHIIRDIIDMNANVNFILGGYVDKNYFGNFINVFWYDSIKDFAIDMGFDYSYGCDWSLFADTECTPRLTLSTGCLNGCKFCTIPHKLNELSQREVLEQAYAFHKLKFKLVYIDDKTFGQAKNCWMLDTAYHRIKYYNPDFEGFIIQTTAKEILKRDKEFWIDNHIRIVELGAETLNDNILEKYRKPHDTSEIYKATGILKRLGIKIIWNIILGFPEESRGTYLETLRGIRTAKDYLYSLNIFTLSAYQDNDIKGDDDGNENRQELSWLDAEHQELYNEFRTKIYKQAIKIVED